MNHIEFMKLFERFPVSERYAIEHAYILSKDAHRSQTRRDGERYFEHPRRATLILVQELGVLSWEDICATLLHDTIEDTKYITADKLRHWFNWTVADMVDLMTRKEGEVQRQYYERMRDYPRVALIKGCDRLDNLRSMSNLPTEFIEKQIHGTQKHVIPLLEGHIAEKMSFSAEKMVPLLSSINQRIHVLQKEVKDRNTIEPCNSGMQCGNMKRRKQTMCDECYEEYREDPEAFK